MFGHLFEAANNILIKSARKVCWILVDRKVIHEMFVLVLFWAYRPPKLLIVQRCISKPLAFVVATEDCNKTTPDFGYS